MGITTIRLVFKEAVLMASNISLRQLSFAFTFDIKEKINISNEIIANVILPGQAYFK